MTEFALWNPGECGVGAAYPEPASRRSHIVGALTLAATVALLFAAPAGAFSEWAVDRTDDVDPAAHPASRACVAGQPDDCTLRGALARANGTTQGSLITLPAGIYRRDRALGRLVAFQSVTIQGAGARTTVIQGAGAPAFLEGSVLAFSGQGEATPRTSEIRDVTISNGAAILYAGGVAVLEHQLSLVRVAVTGNRSEGVGATGGFGGGVAVGSAKAQLTVDDSVIAGNQANAGTSPDARGGGLGVLAGSATVRDSTIAGNVADGDTHPALGGGVAVVQNGTATFAGVTVAGNRAQDAGAGQAVGNLYREAAGTSKLSLARSLIADGAAPAGSNSENCSAPITSLGGNVEDRDQCGLAPASDRAGLAAGLGPLQDNGGPTDTRAITPASPAFDFGGQCTTGDQRGLARAFAACDSGAFEVQPAPAAAAPPATPARGAPGAVAAPRCSLRLAGTTRDLRAMISCDRAATAVLAGAATFRAARTHAGLRRVALRRRTTSVPAVVHLRVPRSVAAAVRRKAWVSIALTATLTGADGARASKTATMARLQARKKRPRS